MGLKKEHEKNHKKKECDCKECCHSDDKFEDSQEKNEIESLKKELEETKQLLLRTAAEYDNFRCVCDDGFEYFTGGR